MTAETSRRLRADAARNSEKILRAARLTWSEVGPDASLEQVARRAGVGIATLYRRFPDKAELVRAALAQTFAEDMAPAIEQALADDDPRRGMSTVLEAALSLAAREHSTLAAARNAGAMTAESSAGFFEVLTLLTQRAQQAGLVRADLVPDDMPRIMVMLVSVLWTMDPNGDGRKRYLSLLMDALSTEASGPLPAAAPAFELQTPGSWSM